MKHVIAALSAALALGGADLAAGVASQQLPAAAIEARLKRLEDVEQVRQLLADYIRFVDSVAIQVDGDEATSTSRWTLLVRGGDDRPW